MKIRFIKKIRFVKKMVFYKDSNSNSFSILLKKLKILLLHFLNLWNNIRTLLRSKLLNSFFDVRKIQSFFNVKPFFIFINNIPRC